MKCFFVSDLHGNIDRYEKLFDRIAEERPGAVMLGGDLLPFGGALRSKEGEGDGDFISRFLAPRLRALRQTLDPVYPSILLILGNDDPRAFEENILSLEREGLLSYMHERWIDLGAYTAAGYACVPPTPFRLKDWECYDISRFVDPGCLSPEEGMLSVPVPEREKRFRTIAADLDTLASGRTLDRAVLLFHTPPYDTALDRAALDGKMVDHAPLDVHIGSMALRRFIEKSRPLLTLHGHVHESARITGSWRDRIGSTVCLSAAHDGPELALVRVDLDDPEAAKRELV